MDRYTGDDQPTGGQIEDDIVPDGAARGGVTVPDANDTGMTTPPISGWGDSVEEVAEEDEEETVDEPA